MNRDQKLIYNNYRLVTEQSSNWKTGIVNVQPGYKDRTVTAVNRQNAIHNPLDDSKLHLVANAIYSIKELSPQEKNKILSSFASPEFIKGFTASLKQQGLANMYNQQAASSSQERDPGYVDPDEMYADLKANREAEEEGKRGGIDVVNTFLYGQGTKDNPTSEYGEYYSGPKFDSDQPRKTNK